MASTQPPQRSRLSSGFTHLLLLGIGLAAGWFFTRLFMHSPMDAVERVFGNAGPTDIATIVMASDVPCVVEPSDKPGVFYLTNPTTKERVRVVDCEHGPSAQVAYSENKSIDFYWGKYVFFGSSKGTYSRLVFAALKNPRFGVGKG